MSSTSGTHPRACIIVVEGNCVLGAERYVVGAEPIVVRNPERRENPEVPPQSKERSCE